MATILISRPEWMDLAIPAVPQPIDQIMENYPGEWEAAGNGPFADTRKGARTAYNPVETNVWGDLIRNGVRIQGPTGEKRPRFVIYHGSATIHKQPAPDIATLAFEGGPLLVESGNPTYIPKEVKEGRLESTQPTIKRQRTGIGIRPNNEIVYISMLSATLAEFQQKFLDAKCMVAMALDGGGTTRVLHKQHGVLVDSGEKRLQPCAVVFNKLLELNTPEHNARIYPPRLQPEKPGAAGQVILTRYLPVYLRPGDEGDFVGLFQWLMQLAGHDPGPIDGKYGSRTTKAVMDYQRRYGLKVDGEIGNQTWTQLKQPVHLLETAGPNFNVTPHFRLGEFACKHCQSLILAYLPDLATILEEVRSSIGDKPITITSGYRCPIHNRNVGGAPASQHLYGKAADVVAKGVPYNVVADAAEQVFGNTGGVLRYPKKKFTHIDLRPEKTWRVME